MNTVDDIQMKDYLNVHGISAAEAAKFETLFKLLDSDERGGINEEELADLMPRMGVFLSQEELHGLFMSVDVDGSGEIDFREFLQLMAQHREESQLQLLEGGGEAFQQLKRASKMKHVLASDDPLTLALDIIVTITLFLFCCIILYEDIRWSQVPNGMPLKLIGTVIYLLDVARGFVTSVNYTNFDRIPVDDRSIVWRQYIASKRFKIDVLSGVPVDIVLEFCGLSIAARAVQHVRLLKFAAVPSFFVLTPRDVLGPGLATFYYSFLPLLQMLYTMLLVVHLLTMFWILIHPASDDVDYITAVYFVLQTLTTTGYGDIDVTTPEQKMYCIFLFGCASVVTGLVVGKLVAFSQQADLVTDAHQVMLETLAALNHLTIPNDFKEEVLAFQLHRLKHSNSLFNDAINGLPECMQDRMALYARMKIVRQVPIFAEATEICIAKLAQSLVNVFVPPEEFIVIAGEEGEEMFFLFHGMCGVSLANGKWVATIKRGGVFGEVALLESTRRSASIKSLTYCQLFRLDKLAFEAIVAKFPVLLESIKKVSVALQTRLNKPPVSPSSKKRASEDAEAKSTGSDAKGEAENAITAAPLNAPSMMKKERSRNRSMALSQKSANAGGEAEQRERARSNSRVQVESDEASSDSSASIGAVPTHVSDNSDESSDAGKDQDSAASTPSRRTRLNSILGDHAMAQVLKTKSMPPTGPPPPPRRPRLSFGKLKRMKNSTPEVELQARVDKICTVLGRMVYKDLVVPADGSPMAVPESPVPLPVPSDAPT
eukprot:TRINITY_DN2058_c0_g3_i1.p1 TRINITY_DN2058_c0_g3~~TRINITY_DN2058_c0_g3_i1.p1  ORF type:complete len:771 (+),score=277.93 TRINITY_DN2058_c0_g3_i1:241-2553(+)